MIVRKCQIKYLCYFKFYEKINIKLFRDLRELRELREKKKPKRGVNLCSRLK